jgi:hypothetical protein
LFACLFASRCKGFRQDGHLLAGVPKYDARMLMTWPEENLVEAATNLHLDYALLATNRSPLQRLLIPTSISATASLNFRV